MEQSSFVRAAYILGISLVLSFFVGGLFFLYSRSNNSVSVTGSARQTVEADMVKWRLALTRDTSFSTSSEGYRAIDRDSKRVLSFLKESGVVDAEVTTTPVFMNEQYQYGEYRPAEKMYTLRQEIEINSSRIDEIAALAKSSESIANIGVPVSTTSLEYFYEGLPDLRVELLSLAVQDAQTRAQAIGKSTNAHVGKLTSASGGVVQVLSKNSVDVSDYGTYDTSARTKEVMVTVRASFRLR